MIKHYFSHLKNNITQQPKWLTLFLFCLVSVLLAYQLIKFSLILRQGFTPSIIIEKNSSLQLLSHPDISTITNLNLLGTPPIKNESLQTGNPRFHVQKTMPDDQLLLQAPLAKINARLVGMISSKNPALAIAIIEHNGEQNSYFINDFIAQGNYKLIRIFSDRVIIDEDGYYAALFID